MKAATRQPPATSLCFATPGEACASLEHWWVENGEGFAFTAAGVRLALGVDERNSRVIVTGQQAAPNSVEVVKGWLHAYASAVLEARRAKAGNGKAVLSPSEERGQLPTSIEGLIAYVGFDS